ncbi:MAG TPA: hypothetical protein VEW48_24890 [Thermoanaerobaculia bacterium]|nr:hypothetical protein [Thermoanaerobaculia bacterium]
MATPETSAHDLDEVRSELRRLGYLNHGFERFLLQDALRPRRPGPTLVRLTLKVGLLASLVLALPLALGLVIANAAAEPDPLEVSLDTLVLFLHLFLPISAVIALGFLALCGIVLAALRFSHVRRIETLSLAVALVVGALGLLVALQGVRALLAESRLPLLLALGLAAPFAIYALIKLVYHGLLTLAIRFTDTAPGGRLFSRRWLGLAILAAAFVLTLPAVLSTRREPPAAPTSLPVAPGDRVVLFGIDGVLPEELDYLLNLGDLPTLASLLHGNAGIWSYPRKDEPPASFWTTIATGIPGPDHGVAALDSFRPLGVRTPLARNGPLRGWWSGVEVPLGLAEYRPVLANRRRAFTFWELASRGGAPVVAVNWWGTFPAEELPGLVVAHGAWQLLQEKAEGAAAPAVAQPPLAALARDAARPAGDGIETRLDAALPREAAAGVLRRALIPDRFYREVFERELARQPRAAALYLPALDIAADGWQGGDVAFADLVRSELRAADLLLGRSLSGVGTVIVVLDPGRRRHAGGGRIVLWRRGGRCGAPRPRGAPALAPEAVASVLLRALGLPQSEQLPVPPAACGWPEPPLVVSGYGERGERPTQGPEGREYLESLRSLGYL